ncbi:MAG TPA: hypothetical protein DD670_20325 [Planctomycetaceae bacterium]|nr:hypothetical protein [Planctomycetaceae bacterium]
MHPLNDLAILHGVLVGERRLPRLTVRANCLGQQWACLGPLPVDPFKRCVQISLRYTATRRTALTASHQTKLAFTVRAVAPSGRATVEQQGLNAAGEGGDRLGRHLADHSI